MGSPIQEFAKTLPKKYENTGPSLDKSIVDIINAVIGVLGLACVVVMIIGGVQYMTSTGDAGKVEKGKKTILYGAIGLIICVLSFAIVNFTISHFMGGDDGGGGNNSQEEEPEKTQEPQSA